mgnify:FL=1
MDPRGSGFFRSEVAVIKAFWQEQDLSERFLGFRIHGRGMEESLYKNLDTSLISDYNPEYEIGLKGEIAI